MLKRLLVLIVCFSLLPAIFAFTNVKKKKPVQKIIIDPGHGGKDQGAKGLISTEAQLCLEMGLKLGKSIEQNFPNIKVLYTRTTDVLAGFKYDKNESLRYRADFANQSGADLFIAIHCNASGRRAGGWYEKRVVDYHYKKVWVGKGKKRKQVTRRVPVYQSFYVENKTNGTETYVWAADRSDEKEENISPEEMTGESDSTIMYNENDPVLKAYRLLYTKKFFQTSVQLASYVEQEFVKSGRISRGVKQRNNKGIWVLQATGMPSVLVETGFISNREEEKYLNSEDGQNEIVRNITDALRNYIAYMDKQPVNNNNTQGKTPDTKVTNAKPELVNRKETSKLSPR